DSPPLTVSQAGEVAAQCRQHVREDELSGSDDRSHTDEEEAPSWPPRPRPTPVYVVEVRRCDERGLYYEHVPGDDEPCDAHTGNTSEGEQPSGARGGISSDVSAVGSVQSAGYPAMSGETQGGTARG